MAKYMMWKTPWIVGLSSLGLTMIQSHVSRSSGATIAVGGCYNGFSLILVQAACAWKENDSGMMCRT